MTDEEKETNLTLRTEYAGLMVRFNSTQTLRSVFIAGYFALHAWLLNLLLGTLAKYSVKHEWIEGSILIFLPVVAWLSSNVANAIEDSFARGLTETIDRGIEIEVALKQKGIFTVSRESYLQKLKGGSITWAMRKGY